MNQADFVLGYDVITIIFVLVVTKEISLGTDFNQENWMLVTWLLSVLQYSIFPAAKDFSFYLLTSAVLRK